MERGNTLLVIPATEDHCLSDLTEAEAEEVLDWIQDNDFHLQGVSYQKNGGFAIRWDVR